MKPHRIRRGLSLLSLVLLAAWLNHMPARADGIFLQLQSVTEYTNSEGVLLRRFNAVHVAENKAYLAGINTETSNSTGGLDIYDVSNPASPTLLGRCEGRSEANALRVVGRYAYVAAGTSRNGTNDPGWLEIFDVSDVAHPTRVGGIETPGRGLGLQVAEGFAYVAEGVRWTGSNLLGALEIFDVRNPANPVRIATHDTGAAATSVDILGRHAYLADGLTDLEVIDVSNPTAPSRVGGYDTDEWRNYGGYEHGGAAVHIQVANGLVYSAGEDGLHILSVTNRAVPVRIGGYNALPFDYAFNVSGRYASMSMWHSFQNAFWLYVWDVSSPADPAWLCSTEVPGSPKSIQVAGPSMYVAAGPLLIYEVSEEPAFRSIWTNGEIVELSWNAPVGFRLQSTSSLINPDWRDVADVGDATRVSLPVGDGHRFFRLYKP